MRAPAAPGRPARLRRATASVGSVRKAVPMSNPAATSTISSHRGSPATVDGFACAGLGCPLATVGATRCAGAVDRVDAGAGAGAGAFADVGVGAWRGAGDPDGACRGAGGTGGAGVRRGISSTVPTRIALGSVPTVPRLAAYSAGQPPGGPSAVAMPDRVSPAATVYRASAAGPGSVRTVPGLMRPGSGPTAGRRAAYSAGQPPRTPSAAAMPDRVSPGCTT